MSAQVKSNIEESKHERFYRIMEPRISNAIHQINLLAYGSDTTRYEASTEEIDIMEKVLSQAVTDMITLYRASMRKLREPFQFRPREYPHDEETELGIVTELTYRR